MAMSRIVRNLKGQIVDWEDPKHGVIVAKGRIVNPEAWNEYQQKEADKREAAKAASLKSEADPRVVEERNNAPSKIEEVEKKFDQKFEELEKKIDNKFDQILNALKPQQ